MKILLIKTLNSLLEDFLLLDPIIVYFVTPIIGYFGIYMSFKLYRMFAESEIDFYEVIYSKPGEYETVSVKAKSYEEVETATYCKIETLDNRKLIIPKQNIYDVKIVYKEKDAKKIKSSHIL